jgi:glycosyltransferase involved in cell wall biosynthesis
MPGMLAPESKQETPLVSIVTPSLNSARFIAETIESIAAQDYPNIEHIVVDGGSKDGTLEIVARYPKVRVLTGADRGAADAINRGFSESRGVYFNYVNSDDILLPGAIRTMVSALNRSPDAAGVYGRAWWIDEHGERIAKYPVREFRPRLLASECFVCQPASLLRRDVFEKVGRLNPDYDLTFDYEFWMRLSRTHTLTGVAEELAYSRMHRSNKSLGKRGEVFRETFQILRLHYEYVPFRWVLAEACHRADGRDQFFEPMRPTLARYFESLPLGLSANPNARRRYLTEWLNFPNWPRVKRHLLARKETPARFGRADSQGG